MDTAKDDARAIFTAAVAAVEPRAAVRAHCRVEDDVLIAGSRAYPLTPIRRLTVVGAGKASALMAQELEELLGPRIAGGVVVVKHGHGAALERMRIVEAGHPLPDADGERGAQAIAAALRGAQSDDLVLACWSGGASALTPAPRPGLSLADKQAVTALLLGCGAAIGEINAVRKHLSWLKGGQLARLVAPAQVLCLAISDVVGDDPAVIGSGPFSPDATTFLAVEDILTRYRISHLVPEPVSALIRRGLRGEETETPKAGDPCFARVQYLLVADNRQALVAAAQQARARGYDAVLWPSPLVGEAGQAAAAFCAEAKRLQAVGRRICLIAGGETTVTLGPVCGRGGRNQEFALASAAALAGHPGITVLAGGSDGNDGPTDAAGALVDANTWGRAQASGHPPSEHLARHDAYPLFAALGDLLLTGPTRTNVMDLSVALCSPG